MGADTDQTDRAGVALCDLRITKDVGFIFRAQPTSDFGVDAHIEVKHDGQATGRLLGLQIKSGDSWFSEQTPDGWRFRPEAKHIDYWISHSLPMFILLVNLNEEAIYWAELSTKTLQSGPRGGVFVLVPRENTLSSAESAWRIAAERFRTSALDSYADNLGFLPPSTAQKIRAIADTASEAAALLAAHLAGGRRSPAVTIRALLDSEPAWLSAAGQGTGLVAIADYAISHGRLASADYALELAACRDSANADNHTLLRAIISLDSDRAQAEQLLQSIAGAADTDPLPRIAMSLAVLGHPVDDASPIAMDSDLMARLEGTEDPLVLSYLAIQFERRMLLDRGVDVAQKALSLAPDESGFMELLARLLMKRSRTQSAVYDDQRRSVELAEDALDQIHRWSGPTSAALDTTLDVLRTAGKFARVLDRCLPAPSGLATEEEAARTSVQFAAVIAAWATDDLELAHKLAEALPAGVDQELARLQLGLVEDLEDSQSAWLSVLDQLDDSRPELILRAVTRLSELGVDSSSRLQPLADRSVIDADVPAVTKAIAEATADLTRGLPNLRALADTSDQAAAHLVDLLAKANRPDDAVAAAELADSRFGGVHFRLQQANLLLGLDRLSEAEDAANDVLGSHLLDSVSARNAHRLLGRISLTTLESHPDRQEEMLASAERHIDACVNDADLVVSDINDVWLLVEVQNWRGKPGRALQTLNRHDPAISTASQAWLWARVMAQQETLPLSAATRIIELADEFETDAQLSGNLLMLVITRTRDPEDSPATPADTRPVLPGEQRAKAWESVQRQIAQHGSESPIKVLQSDSPEELVQRLTEMMRHDAKSINEIGELASRSLVPLGLFAQAVRKPYASIVCIRPLRYTIASTAMADDDANEEASARAAFDRDVVVDVSAVSLSTALGEYDALRGRYRSLIVPAATRADLGNSGLDLRSRSASGGVLAFDDTTDSLAATELDVEHHLATLERFAALDAAMSAIRVVSNASVARLGEIDIPTTESWLAPIALAHERGLPLWSDDVAQRRVARELGVDTFGTITLQQVRTLDRIEDPNLDDVQLAEVLALRRREILRCMRERVVDVPVDVDMVIEQGRAESWSDEVALITVARTGWWHLAPNAWSDLRAILTSIEEDGYSADAWRYRAMFGAALLGADEPSRAGLLLACVALLPTGAQPHPEVEETTRHLSVAGRFSLRRKSHPPENFLTSAASLLADVGVLQNQSDFVLRLRERVPRIG